eukprot:m.110198 g.110198  ORF g.110198 m.110198 type:complete len:309 (+) comp12879_c1_seq1:140-1066(+)
MAVPSAPAVPLELECEVLEPGLGSRSAVLLEALLQRPLLLLLLRDPGHLERPLGVELVSEPRRLGRQLGPSVRGLNLSLFPLGREHLEELEVGVGVGLVVGLIVQLRVLVLLGRRSPAARAEGGPRRGLRRGLGEHPRGGLARVLLHPLGRLAPVEIGLGGAREVPSERRVLVQEPVQLGDGVHCREVLREHRGLLCVAATDQFPPTRGRLPLPCRPARGAVGCGGRGDGRIPHGHLWEKVGRGLRWGCRGLARPFLFLLLLRALDGSFVGNVAGERAAGHFGPLADLRPPELEHVADSELWRVGLDH